MAGGRPPIYKPEYVQQILEFFNVEPFEIEHYIDGNGAERTRLKPNKFPTLARFAANLDIDRGTLADWADKKDEHGDLVYPEFSRAYKRAKDFQEAILAEGGMAGAYETPFAIFTAKNVIGWRDKQEIDNTHSAPGGGPIAHSVAVSYVDPPRED